MRGCSSRCCAGAASNQQSWVRLSPQASTYRLSTRQTSWSAGIVSRIHAAAAGSTDAGLAAALLPASQAAAVVAEASSSVPAAELALPVVAALVTDPEQQGLQVDPLLQLQQEVQIQQLEQIRDVRECLESSLELDVQQVQQQQQTQQQQQQYKLVQQQEKQRQSPPPVHRWGQGLSVDQFVAALQALPQQQAVSWKSLYPAIGEGSRGKVYQAVNLDTGGMLAVKVVSLKHFMGPGTAAALRREALVLELAAMQDLQHPNLLAMQGFNFRLSGGRAGPGSKLEIFSELGTCLEDLLPDDGDTPLGLGLVQKVMTALVSALDFLHDRGVVHRDVKPGNIVSVGAGGTFKLIDMDSIFYTHTWEGEEEEDEEDEQDQQQQQQQGRRRRRQLQSGQGGGMGDPCPASMSAHLAGGAAALQQQQHRRRQREGSPPAPVIAKSAKAAPGPSAVVTTTTSTAAAAGGSVHYLDSATAGYFSTRTGLAHSSSSTAVATTAVSSSGSSSSSISKALQHQQQPQQQQQQQQQQAAAAEINALSFAGTPENMAPEAAPTVLQLGVVLWDLFPLVEGKQVASSTAVAPAQDIWSTGTVLYELLTGSCLFPDHESPEALYQHYAALRAPGSSEMLPLLPPGLDADVVAVVGACLQVDPAARPTAKQLLAMDFFTKTY